MRADKEVESRRLSSKAIVQSLCANIVAVWNSLSDTVNESVRPQLDCSVKAVSLNQ